MDVFHAARRALKENLVVVFHGKFREALNVVGREKVVVEGVLDFILDESVLFKLLVIADLTGKILLDEVLVAGKGTRGNLAVIERREGETPVDLFKAQRTFPLQKVYEVKALLKF